MARKILKRFLPDPYRIKQNVHLRYFGEVVHDPLLWHLTRRSVPGAFSIGLFVAFLPLPFHMVLAAALAILWRVNLPISVALVWVNNPFTMAPLFYSSYKVGAWVLGERIHRVKIEPTLTWLVTQLKAIWPPFLLGCLICGVVAAIAGNLFIRAFWRWNVARNWKARRRRLAQRQAGQASPRP